MLDLYLHDDGTPFTSDPDEQKHLTGLSLEEFCELKKFEFIPDKISFYEDCIWKSNIVGAALRKILHCRNQLKQTPGFEIGCLKRYEEALETAQKEGSGLLFLSD